MDAGFFLQTKQKAQHISIAVYCVTIKNVLCTIVTKWGRINSDISHAEIYFVKYELPTYVTAGSDQRELGPIMDLKTRFSKISRYLNPLI